MWKRQRISSSYEHTFVSFTCRTVYSAWISKDVYLWRFDVLVESFSLTSSWSASPDSLCRNLHQVNCSPSGYGHLLLAFQCCLLPLLAAFVCFYRKVGNLISVVKHANSFTPEKIIFFRKTQMSCFEVLFVCFTFSLIYASECIILNSV